MPIFSITRRDPLFFAIVQAMTFATSAVSNPQLTSASAASDAYPFPQASRRNLKPISATSSLSKVRQNQPTKTLLSIRRAVHTSGSIPLGMRNVTCSGSVVSWLTAPPLRKRITSESSSRSIKSLRSAGVQRLSLRLAVCNSVIGPSVLKPIDRISASSASLTLVKALTPNSIP